MKVLLDTNVFLRGITGGAGLSKSQRSLWTDDGNELILSVASVWEMLIKAELKKLPLPTPAADYIQRQLAVNQIAMLGIRAQHLAELEKLPPLHRDPFDRMIVAQAVAERLPIASTDATLRRYGVKVI